jgi:hypothetical protein
VLVPLTPILLLCASRYLLPVSVEKQHRDCPGEGQDDDAPGHVLVENILKKEIRARNNTVFGMDGFAQLSIAINEVERALEWKRTDVRNAAGSDSRHIVEIRENSMKQRFLEL